MVQVALVRLVVLIGVCVLFSGCHSGSSTPSVAIPSASAPMVAQSAQGNANGAADVNPRSARAVHRQGAANRRAYRQQLSNRQQSNPVQ